MHQPVGIEVGASLLCYRETEVVAMLNEPLVKLHVVLLFPPEEVHLRRLKTPRLPLKAFRSSQFVGRVSTPHPIKVAPEVP